MLLWLKEDSGGLDNYLVMLFLPASIAERVCCCTMENECLPRMVFNLELQSSRVPPSFFEKRHAGFKSYFKVIVIYFKSCFPGSLQELNCDIVGMRAGWWRNFSLNIGHG